MEPKSWINSSEEMNQSSEQETVDLGVGRSYECVFCKRGFNTAQALGGHMNIHRKDRLKNKPNSSKQEDYLSPPSMYHQINIPPPPDIIPDQIFTCFPVSSTAPGIEGFYGNGYGGYQHHHHQFLAVDSDHDHQIKPLDHPVVPVGVGDRDNWSLSLRFLEDLERDKNHKEELDLELRLGYDS